MAEIDPITEEELIRLGRRYLALHKEDRGPWPLEFREKLRALEDEYDSEEHPIDTVSFQHYETWVNRCEHFETQLAQSQAREAELREALEWYAEKARSLSKNDWKDKPHIAEAMFVELSLDAGRRARSVYGGE